MRRCPSNLWLKEGGGNGVAQSETGRNTWVITIESWADKPLSITILTLISNEKGSVKFSLYIKNKLNQVNCNNWNNLFRQFRSSTNRLTERNGKASKNKLLICSVINRNKEVISSPPVILEIKGIKEGPSSLAPSFISEISHFRSTTISD